MGGGGGILVDPGFIRVNPRAIRVIRGKPLLLRPLMEPTQFVAQAVFLLAEAEFSLFFVHLGDDLFEVPVLVFWLAEIRWAARLVFVVSAVR